MNTTEAPMQTTPPVILMRFVCFVVFATVGMVAIALALLAEPLTKYYRDQAVLQTLQQRIQTLQQFHDQQAELLANLHNPSVLERAAISNLRYVHLHPQIAIAPDPTNYSPWPELQAALKNLDVSPPPPPQPYQKLAEQLALNPSRQSLLLLLGCALVLISLSCFYRQS